MIVSRLLNIICSHNMRGRLGKAGKGKLQRSSGCHSSLLHRGKCSLIHAGGRSLAFKPSSTSSQRVQTGREVLLALGVDVGILLLCKILTANGLVVSNLKKWESMSLN